MDQIIIEHYKNSYNFISLKNFKIPFIVDNGLYFNKEIVYNNKLEEGILINEKLNASNSRVAIKEGFWIYYYENGNKYLEENFKNGICEGLWIEWYENGNKMSEGNYENGKEEEHLILWYENGIKCSEGNYKNNKKEGFWINWYKNGQLNASNSHVAIRKLEGNYKDGKLNGLYISWDENGKLNNQQVTKELEENYVNNSLI